MSNTSGSTRTGGGAGPTRGPAPARQGSSAGSSGPAPRQGAGRPRPAGRATGRMSPTAAPGDGEPRKAKLTVSRIDPFSVMKISFLLSVALGIAGVVVVAALWLMLNSMGVFATINDTFNELQASAQPEDRFSVIDILGFGRVLSLSIVFGVVDVILMTAIATITAFIYNICAALVGGMQVTLTDD